MNYDLVLDGLEPSDILLIYLLDKILYFDATCEKVHKY